MNNIIGIYELKQGEIGELIEPDFDTTHVLGIYAVEANGTVRVASLQTGTTWSRQPGSVKPGLLCRRVRRGTKYEMTVR